MLILAVPHGAVGVGVFVQLAFPEDLFDAVSIVVYGFLQTSHVDIVNVLGGSKHVLAELELGVVACRREAYGTCGRARL